MAKFTVFFKRRKTGEFDFETGRIRIGRHPDSEIFIPHQSVSRLHATLELKDDAWILENVGAKNGLFLNGSLVRVAGKVKEGDKIEFGNYTVTMDGGEESDVGDMIANLSGQARAGGKSGLTAPAPHAPVPVGTEQYDATFKMSKKEVVEQRRESHKLTGTHLSWQGPDGAEVVIPLGNHAVRIGSGNDADIQVEKKMLVGKVHATIEASSGRHVVFPAAWWTRVTVNGRKIKASHSLQDGDKIHIGDTTLRYRGDLFE